jgi:hypothetical protein
MSLLEQAEPHGHLVQLYGSDEAGLAKNVGRYLVEGLKRGDGLLVIATPAHTAAFAREIMNLEYDSEAVVSLDAEDTLNQCMVRGQPNWDLFEKTVGAAMRTVRKEPDHVGFRAYGEMVGILWNEGRYAAAIQLERFWNKLLNINNFSLFCAYPIDVFSNEFQIAPLDALLCAHTHLVPAGRNGDLDLAIDQSMDDVLGRRATGLRQLMEANFRPSWAVMPKAEANILWLRNNLPDEAEKIVARARKYYQTSQLRPCFL